MDDVYVAPGGEFQVDVPPMRNPFIKAPSQIVERRLRDGGAEVTLSVLDLGEAWRFGVRSGTASLPDASLADLCDAELDRWRHEGPHVAGTRGANDPAASAPRVVLEESVAFATRSGLARIYHVDGAALTHRQQDGRARAALIGVAVARTDAGLLFAVGQFDMPMDQWDFFIDDVGLQPERILDMMANEDLKALRARVASLRSASAEDAGPGRARVQR